MLKFSDVRLDNLHMRLDSEHFMKEYLDFFKSVTNTCPLGDFVKAGYRVIYENTEIINKEEGISKNYPIFLQANDLQTPFIKADRLFYVHEKDWIRYPKGRINRGELLIEVKGKIEKVALVPDDFLEKVLVTESIYKLTVNQKVSKHYLPACLICKYGVAFKNRYKTNLLISFLSKDDLYRIPVPIFSTDFKNRIFDTFQKIFEDQKKAKVIYGEAEIQLLKTLDIANYSPSVATVNIKSFKKSFGRTGRLDAEYFSPVKENALATLECLSNCTVGDLFYSIRNAWQTNKAHATEKVRNYDLSDALSPFLDDSKKPVERTEIACTKKIIQGGDLIVSRLRSYLKEIAVVKPGDGTLMVASSEFIVLRPKTGTVLPVEALLVYLRSELPQLVFKWSQDGSNHPRFDEGELLRLPVPKAVIARGSEFVAVVQSMISSKERSTQLLEAAKRAVEIAIEQDEAAGMAYLAIERALA